MAKQVKLHILRGVQGQNWDICHFWQLQNKIICPQYTSSPPPPFFVKIIIRLENWKSFREIAFNSEPRKIVGYCRRKSKISLPFVHIHPRKLYIGSLLICRFSAQNQSTLFYTIFYINCAFRASWTQLNIRGTINANGSAPFPMPTKLANALNAKIEPTQEVFTIIKKTLVSKNLEKWWTKHDCFSWLIPLFSFRALNWQL